MQGGRSVLVRWGYLGFPFVVTFLQVIGSLNAVPRGQGVLPLESTKRLYQHVDRGRLHECLYIIAACGHVLE